MGEGGAQRRVGMKAAMKKIPLRGAVNRARRLRHEMTDAEKKVWQFLRSRQMAGLHFRRQVPLGRYIADFVCHDAALIVEIDGGQHDVASNEEIARTKFLEGEGYRVLRFWNNAVLANPKGVHALIEQALQQDHPLPDPPPSKGRES
jgi:very-short-patch-repair endonuclease